MDRKSPQKSPQYDEQTRGVTRTHKRDQARCHDKLLLTIIVEYRQSYQELTRTDQETQAWIATYRS